ncbi:OB-fold protein [Fulvivirga sediminis]|uniref:tRNA_anti-like n=1 Tax=Fulvivirga sediminis TaxID=2803949 RepID=A0A937F7N4_9BACT|nr:hypothetical protein [Fulvivirga sediminis]MBL3655830.1 hypothetical protein [Fulvivirga sediminis]
MKIGKIVMVIAIISIVTIVLSLTLDFGEADAEIKVPATELATEYLNNEDSANQKYLGKIIEVSGEVQSFEEGENPSVVLGSGSDLVRCIFKDNSTSFKVGQKVTISGNCSGYLLEVVLEDCKQIKE